MGILPFTIIMLYTTWYWSYVMAERPDENDLVLFGEQ